MEGKSSPVELKVFRHVWKLLFRKNACSKEFIWARRKNNPPENKSTGTTSLTVTSCSRNPCSCTLLKPLDNKQCSSFTRLCTPTDGRHWLRNQHPICASLQFLYLFLLHASVVEQLQAGGRDRHMAKVVPDSESQDWARNHNVQNNQVPAFSCAL